MKFFGNTDVGSRRSNNEDSFFAEKIESRGLFIVADGMGGHKGGEVASSMAIDTIYNEMLICDAKNMNKITSLRSAVKSASKRIYRHAQRNDDLFGMGTTVDVCIVDGLMAYIAHVGDSRVYLLRDNKLHQITTDHSLVEEMVQNNQITPEEALVHPMRNIITRALGEENILVDTIELELTDSDKLLLCSDGLSGMVSDEDICGIMLEGTPQTIVENLIKKANNNGGDDNITAVVVFIEKREEE